MRNKICIIIGIIIGISLMTNIACSKEETVSINMNKTYEQCERQAFDRLYEVVNKLLDEEVLISEQENVNYIEELAYATRNSIGSHGDEVPTYRR